MRVKKDCMDLKVGITMGINNQSDKNGIKRDIEELREALNEICAMEEGNKIWKKRLILSQQLDQLIVAYMNKDKE